MLWLLLRLLLCTVSLRAQRVPFLYLEKRSWSLSGDADNGNGMSPTTDGTPV